MGVSIKLLGGPVVTRPDGHVVRLPTRKSEALLVYLLERDGEAVSREALADLLWPLSGEEQARASLRQEVSVLRKALGPDVSDIIVAQGDRIEILKQGLEADIWRIRAAHPEADDPATVLALLDLYTAPFLDSFRLRSQPFTDWVWATRLTLEAETLSLGSAARRKCFEKQNCESATKIAHQLCRIEPTYEPAHRVLIENHLRNGDVGSAQRQFRQCEVALKTVLDAEVSEETLKLMELVGSSDLAPPTPGVSVSLDRDPPAQQRRFITALSVLANFQIDDPEDFDCAAKDATQQIRAIVEAKGGVISRVFGDHVLAYFGYPIGHDTDPDTAVFAAFEILEALKSRQDGAALCQIGLSYGHALVSDQYQGGTAQPKISGAVLRSAESVSHLGLPGVVTVDLEVEKVLSPAIRLLPLDGNANAKKAVSHRQSAAWPEQDLFPEQNHAFVGRKMQIGQFVDLLQRVERGEGAVAAVLGNPGEGKSRLVQEAAQQAVELGFEIKIFQGNRSERQLTFAPVLDHMFRAGAFGGDHAARPALEDWLQGLDPDLVLAAPYFASLVKTSLAGAAKGKDIDDAAKKAALDIFAMQAKARKRKRPVFLIFEDVQWFDPTTCEAISRLIEDVAEAPILAVLVSRASEAPDIVHHPFVHKITLSPLRPQSAETLLRGLLEKTPASEPMLKDVLQRAEGNPLILEEFAKSIAFSQGTTNGSENLIVSTNSPNQSDDRIETPARLLPLLLSRIDSVSGAIQILQYASVFGRRFSHSQLAQVIQPTHAKAPLFSELEEAGILFAARRGADTFYIFKHALISEAIYATILKQERPKMHIAVAETLLSDPQRVHFSEVAHHFKTAAAHDRAVQYFEMSGDQAARVSANAEAVSEYREAIAMIAQLPSTVDRLRKDLALNRKTASRLIALRGIPTQEVTQYYARVKALSAKMGDKEEAANAVWGLWSIHLMVAELDQCLEVATALIPTFEKSGSPVARLIADYMLGVTHAYRGSLQLAAHHLEAVLEGYSDGLKDELQMRFGMDIGLTANSFLGWVYALLDRPEDADAASHRTLRMAKKNENGLSLVFAHVFSATKCLFLDQLTEAKHHAEQALKGADEMGFKQWSAQARMQMARLADLSGDTNALALLQQARADYLATGMVLARPYIEVWIAEAQIRCGDCQAALDTLDALQKYTDLSKQKYFDFSAKNTRKKALGAIAKSMCLSADIPVSLCHKSQ
jgi:DNA-binding SARP family transcriptional activator